MKEFLLQMAELLEEEKVNSDQHLIDFEAWDSLTQLSIIALADDQYCVTISARELQDSKTIDGVWNLIQSKK